MATELTPERIKELQAKQPQLVMMQCPLSPPGYIGIPKDELDELLAAYEDQKLLRKFVDTEDYSDYPTVSAMRREIDRLRKYEVAIKSRHNGYDEDMRASNPELKEPSSPGVAIELLILEAESIAKSEVEFLRAEIARLEAALSKYGDHGIDCPCHFEDDDSACECGFDAAKEGKPG